MASVQRSVFALIASQDDVGVVTPSPARVLSKGSQLMGTQLDIEASSYDPAATFVAVIQGRNGPTDDDWVVVLTGIAPIVTDVETLLLGGFDNLVPVNGFTDLRLNFVQITGVPADVKDLVMTAH